jgi:hypothetical protein
MLSGFFLNLTQYHMTRYHLNQYHVGLRVQRPNRAAVEIHEQKKGEEELKDFGHVDAGGGFQGQAEGDAVAEEFKVLDRIWIEFLGSWVFLQLLNSRVYKNYNA